MLWFSVFSFELSDHDSWFQKSDSPFRFQIPQSIFRDASYLSPDSGFAIEACVRVPGSMFHVLYSFYWFLGYPVPVSGFPVRNVVYMLEKNT